MRTSPGFVKFAAGDHLVSARRNYPKNNRKTEHLLYTIFGIPNRKMLRPRITDSSKPMKINRIKMKTDERQFWYETCSLERVTQQTPARREINDESCA